MAATGVTGASPGAGPPAPDGAPYAVELRGITKRFPGVVANRDIELRVRRGEVHAIVGENGAGKSTLMKTLYGMHRPDEGTILVDGREVHFRSPADAIAAGIGMVHQHFMLADNFTVLENIVLGSEPTRGGRLDLAEARRRIQEISDRYALDLDPDELVEDLGVGDRQRVEIAKVLYRGATTLILDEPTAVLVPQEVDELFGNLAELKREGLTVIFISHKLDEVRKVADSITVIRRGTTVGEADPKTTTARQLAEMMVGSELPSPGDADLDRPRHRRPRAARRDRGDAGRTARWSTTSTSPSARARSWASPASRATARPSWSTRSWACGRSRPARSCSATRTSAPGAPASRREAGFGFIPEDRHRQGMLLEATLWENRILGHQTRAAGGEGLVHRPQGRPHRHRTDHEGLRRPRARAPDTLAVALSGGNQQKLIVGREMESKPRLLVAAHPTRGVDVGAQAAIWELLKDARAEGMAILLISADLDELIGLSDTLKVMLRGQLVATLDPGTCHPRTARRPHDRRTRRTAGAA